MDWHLAINHYLNNRASRLLMHLLRKNRPDSTCLGHVWLALLCHVAFNPRAKHAGHR
jgi:hypothetical protein